ncbi:MAG: VCBS repeat-containing protein, partial [Actinomycetota bacterium]|nr:VCBS repeat-containing protein [Actinomycetota bacterium]
ASLQELANGPLADVSILLGDGTGGYSAPAHFAAGAFANSVAIADFNADKRQDLAVAQPVPANVLILLGHGARSFTRPASFAAGTGPFSAAVGDFNGDARQDVAVANANSDNVSILLNTTRRPAPPTGRHR